MVVRGAGPVGAGLTLPGIEGVTGACEYLADQGLIGKVSAPVRLTRRSNVTLEELAFFLAAEAADAR